MDAAHIHNASKKELFDFVIDHLKKQGEQARYWANGNCVYKSPAGLKCAIGCLFTDIEYDPAMEGHGIESLFRLDVFPERLKPLFRRNDHMLFALQSLHDSNGFQDPGIIEDLRTKFGV